VVGYNTTLWWRGENEPSLSFTKPSSVGLLLGFCGGGMIVGRAGRRKRRASKQHAGVNTSVLHASFWRVNKGEGPYSKKGEESHISPLLSR